MTSNDFSGSADRVVQVGHNQGDLIIQNLPPVPTRPTTVPWQVPPPATGFVNRSAEIGLLQALLADPAAPPRIVVCSGLRGVGTSTTARRIAHLLRGRFPDGQLYVDYAALRHRGGAPVDDAIAGCLRDLGVDDSAVPASLAERSSLFRSKTAEKAIMVVLDEVGEPAHVQALLPNGPGSVVLATSDALLVELLLDGAHLMELEPLSAAAGLALLSVRCGSQRISAEPDAGRQLVELCAGLPVALNVAAARLVTDRRLGVADLVGELTDERNRLRGLTIRGEPVVSAVFTTAYRNLPAPAAQLYRRLGLLPGPDFTVDVAAVLVGTRPDRVGIDDAGIGSAVGLETLVAHGLVQQEASGRFRFHDLVRLHAIDVAQDASFEPAGDSPGAARYRESPDSALRRVIEYYLSRALQADYAVMGERTRFTPRPGERTVPAVEAFTDAAMGLAWLEAERANLMAALRAAEERGWSELVWQFAQTLTALFYNQRHLADWYDSGVRGAAAARICDRPDVEARLWLLTSRAMLDLARYDEADAALNRAERLAENIGSAVLLGSVWEFRGKHLERVDAPAAVDAYRRSIEFNILGKEERGAALSRFFLGAVLDSTGSPAAAIGLLTQAHENLTALGDLRMAARATAALGIAHLHQGHDGQAAELLEQAVAQLAERRAYHYEAQALEDLAAVRERLGDGAGARACLERALEINRMFGSARVDELQASLNTEPSP